MKLKRFALSHLLLLLLASVMIASLSGCRPAAGDTGTDGAAPVEETYIENKGSDTIVNLALAWAEFYQDVHSEVRISVTGGGSGTGRGLTPTSG